MLALHSITYYKLVATYQTQYFLKVLFVLKMWQGVLVGGGHWQANCQTTVLRRCFHRKAQPVFNNSKSAYKH